MPASDCPACGTSLRFVERTQDATPSGHHNVVYECPGCGREVISG